MRTLLTLVLLAAALSAQQPATTPLALPPEIPVEDRLLIRETQVRLAQANINLLNAQIEVQRQETEFYRMLESIKIKHDCRDCIVSADLKFTRPPQPTQAAAQPATPALPTGTADGSAGTSKGEKK